MSQDLTRRGAVHSVSRRGLAGRRALRRFMYAQFTMGEAVKIALGRADPLVRFTVEADPPSVYLVFKVAEGAEQRLATAASLPAGLELAPIACMDGEQPAIYVTLNMYRVSGITNGLRAEWSAYVSDGSGPVRYCVIDARSSARSMDPIDIITPASQVDHARLGSSVVSVLDDGKGRFESTISLPGDLDDRPSARTSPEWATANDLIFWANGVADRTFYDAGMAAADQIRLPGADVVIEDGTRWSTLLEPDPAHVLVFRRPIEFVVSPWANLDGLE